MKTFLLLMMFVFTTASFSQSLPDSLNKMLEKELTDTGRVMLLCRIAHTIQHTDPELAFRLATEAYSSSIESGFRKGTATSLTQLGNIEQVRGDYAKSEEYNLEALGINEKIKDLSGLAINYNNLGILAHNRNDYSVAMDYYRKSLDINKRTGRRSGEATSLYCIGTVHENLMEYDSALFYYFKAQEISEKISDINLAGYGNLSLANVYLLMENYTAATGYYLQAAELYARLNNYLALIKTYMSLGQIAEKAGEIEISANYYRDALKYSSKLKSRVDEANIYLAFGWLYENAGRNDSARIYYDKAGTVFRETDSRHNLVLAMVSQARLYNLDGKYRSAEKILIDAKAVSDQLQSSSAEMEVLLEFSQTYFLLKDFESAYHTLNLYYALKDSVMTAEKQEQILELQTRYETEKKEKENVILRKDREILTTTRNSLIAVAVLMIIIAITITRSLRIKKKDNALLRKQKEEISLQNEILERQKKDITDSIVYARRIQTAMLPADELFNKCFPDSFILYLPRNIVSGDFYWVRKLDEKRIVICVADCTGHGVPGAFMSMLGMSLLDDIVNNYNHSFPDGEFSPSILLNILRDRVKYSLRQTGKEGETRDGMDMSVCLVECGSRQIMYAGANNPVYIVHKGELKELKATRNPIGIYPAEVSFTDQSIIYEPDSYIFMFSDGYADQIGGNGSKFLSKNFKKLLCEISSYSPQEVKRFLGERHLSWRGNEEQVDDILVTGFRVN